VGTPTSVLVESEDAKMVAVGAGRKALVVTVLPSKGDAMLAKRELLKLAETIKMI
jgi:predicted regulator of Ras-like GTPase activity (Roadblock/LC7/MglB family)